MNDNYFTQKDIDEALQVSEIGVWRLESTEGANPRFFGNSIMNRLIGVSDETDPETRYKYFMSRIYPSDMKIFGEYYNTLKNTAKAEVVYRYDHPVFGLIYIRCSGQFEKKVDNTVYYRGIHQNVTNTVRIEQESKNRITEQAEIYRELAFKMMEHSSDSTAKIHLVNGSFELLTFDGNYKEEHPVYELYTKEISENIPKEYRKEYLQNSALENIKRNLEEKGKYSFSTFLHRPSDCELRRVTYWYYPMEDNKDVALSIFTDTTDDYELERKLADALVDAQKANEAKTLFLNNMSHDIRTPMNAIMGFINLAKRYVNDEEKCREYLNKIIISSEHLLSLINDVLDMSRIERGKMELHEEPCSVLDVVEELYMILQNDAKQRKIDLSIDTSEVKNEFVKCDELRLKQIILNCASNALKFTNAGGKVSIKVKQLANDYQFIIADTGIGMSEEFVKTIFDPFTRDEKNVHYIQGTGLGMSICKSIVDMMGGTIDIESKLGVGSTFTISLRLEESSQFEKQNMDAFPIESLSFKGERILLVEDNELNREIALEIFADSEAIIETAENGKIAVDMIRDNPAGYFDLVLMDIILYH